MCYNPSREIRQKNLMFGLYCDFSHQTSSWPILKAVLLETCVLCPSSLRTTPNLSLNFEDEIEFKMGNILNSILWFKTHYIKSHLTWRCVCAAVNMLSCLRCRCEWLTEKIKPTTSKHFGDKNFHRCSFSRNKSNVKKDLSRSHRYFKSLCQVMDWIPVDFTLVAQGQPYRRLAEKQ